MRLSIVAPTTVLALLMLCACQNYSEDPETAIQKEQAFLLQQKQVYSALYLNKDQVEHSLDEAAKAAYAVSGNREVVEAIEEFALANGELEISFEKMYEIANISNKDALPSSFNLENFTFTPVVRLGYLDDPIEGKQFAKVHTRSLANNIFGAQFAYQITPNGDV